MKKNKRVAPETKPSDLIKYALKDIDTIKFSFTVPQEDLTPKTSISHNITPNIKFKPEEDLILVIIRVEILIKERQELLVEAENAFVFHAKNLKDYIALDDKSKSLDFKDHKHEGLLISLVGICLSTMRGILYEKTRGTVLDGNFLPLMNPASFFKPDIDISL